jgi:carbon monoxide dehydrogenase subunit G
MASIQREIYLEACPDDVWDALRDVGQVHTRLAPGFVTDVRMEDGARVVTFGNGRVARERIVTVDDTARRLVWSVVGGAGGAMTHHNASAQVFPEGSGCRFVWIADLLPDALAPTITGMIEQGLAVIGRHVGAPQQERRSA